MINSERLARALIGGTIFAAFFGFVGALLIGVLGGDYDTSRWVCGGLGGLLGFYLLHGPQSFDPTEEDLLRITDYEIRALDHHPAHPHKLAQVGTAVTDILVWLWNLGMAALLRLRLMPVFRRAPYLFVATIFAALIVNPYLGGALGLIAMAALYRNAGSHADFIIPRR